MFSGFFGSQPAQPEANDSKKLRDKQIETFLNEHRSAEIRDPQRTLFTVPVVNHMGKLFVQVELGPAFPERAPIIKLGNILSHPWVDPGTLQIVGHDGLRQWNPYSSLARIVREIAEEFVARPPLPVNQPPPMSAQIQTQNGMNLPPVIQQQRMDFVGANSPASMQIPPISMGASPIYPSNQHSIPSSSAAASGARSRSGSENNSFVMVGSNRNSFGGASSHTHSDSSSSSANLLDSDEKQLAAAVAESKALAEADQAARSKRPTLPKLPDSFPELDGLSISELEALLNDPLEFDEFVAELTLVRELESLVEQAENEVQQIAQQNLSRRFEIQSLQTEISELRSLQNNKIADYDRLLRRHHQIVQKFSMPALVAAASEAVSTADTESENCLDSFMSGNITDSDFLKSYVAARRVYHARQVKLEKLQRSASVSSNAAVQFVMPNLSISSPLPSIASAGSILSGGVGSQIPQVPQVASSVSSILPPPSFNPNNPSNLDPAVAAFGSKFPQVNPAPILPPNINPQALGYPSLRR